MKEKLTKKLTNNIGLKLLSLLIASLLWVSVINSQDPVETVTFHDVPVTVINEDSLAAKDKIPEILEGDTITVVVEARRSICDKLTKNDIIATADFEKISLTDAVPIEVSVNGYSDHEAEIVRGMNQMMKLSLEDSVSKEFRVKIATSGEPASGYVTGSMVASPNMITLTGSSTQISNIKEVVLVVDITGISGESQISGVPIVYDMDGEVVSSSKVTMSATNVRVNIPVLKTKAVRITVHTTGEPATGYEVASVSYEPDSVTVAGTTTDLLFLGSEIRVYCDITGADSVVEKNYDIASLWREELSSLKLVDDEELAVTVTLKELEEKVLEITNNSVEIRGLGEGLKAEIMTLTQNQIRIRGNQVKLKETTLAKLAPYIDLSGYEETGIYEVVIYFKDLSGLLMQDIVKAEVRISAAEPETGGSMVVPQETDPQSDDTQNDGAGNTEDQGNAD